MADYSEEKIAEYRAAIARMREAAPMETLQEEKARNIEDLALGDITEDFLIAHFLDMGDELGVDTRQGSIYWDACMGSIIRTAMFIDRLSKVNDIISLWSCTGDVLDEKLKERGLSRNPPVATPATYYVAFVGEAPELDSVMTCEDYFFILRKREDRYVIVSEDLGSEMNNLVPGTEVIPEIDVDGLVSATLGELVVPAIDIEDDDSARERLIGRLSGPDENGNRSQFKTWCESVEGVGSARIIPLWDGPNTVLGVIVARSGGVPTAGVVDAVQKYVDPGADGMGEGVASIGPIFTAVAVEAVKIDISVSVMKKNEATYADIQESFEERLETYFREMALEEHTDGMAIRYVRVGALLEGLDSIIDYDGLTMNGESENVVFSVLQIPVLGEVSVDGNI